MKVLIISDTHGKKSGIDEIWEKAGKVDLLIHLGDIEGGEIYLDALFDCPKHIVRGNNDYFADLPAEKEIQIGPYKALITHGHGYRVSLGTQWLAAEGRARGVDMVMFGHTHRPYLAQEDGIIVLNPGSVSYPRQEGRRPAYMILEIGEKGELSFQQEFL